MERFKDIHTGDTCFILGNGPSLRDVDLEGLREHGKVFGTNRIYLSGFVPDYYVAVNDLVLEQFGEEIQALDTVKFIPMGKGKGTIAAMPGKIQAGHTYSIKTAYNFDRFFQEDATQPMWEGHTVTYVALQLAYYMGFDRVVLLGVDHDYGKNDQEPNKEIVSESADRHHFDPDYFGKGIRWNLPDLRSSELAYTMARSHYEQTGRQIINCSSSTKLRVFDVQPLNFVLEGDSILSPIKVSAIVSAYKAEQFMEGLWQDIQAQTLWESGKLEIVVVCQKGSPEHYFVSGQIGRVRVITTEDMPTVYAAWNLGIRAARGKYLTNWNTDDRRRPDACEVLARHLDALPAIDLVYPDVYITWELNQDYESFVEAYDGKPIEIGRVQGEPGIFVWREYSKSALADGCFMGPMPMWRANLHQKHGLFIPTYHSAGDYEFWLRIAKTENMLHVPLILGVYAARPDGIELGNLTLNAEEGGAAISTHQTSGVEMLPTSNGWLRIRLGDEWSYVQQSALLKFVKEKYGG